MKNFLISITLFLLSFQVVYSQETVVSEETVEINEAPKHEFGVNVTSLIRNNVFESNALINYPYDFMYNARINDKVYFRTGFLLDVGTLDREEEKDTHYTDFGVRIGLERRLNFSNRMFGSFGFDILYGYTDYNTIFTQFSTFETIQTTNLFGFGPILGFGYNFSKNISARIETNMYYQRSTSTTEFKSDDDFTESVSPQETKSTDLNIIAPLNILFFVHF